MINLQFVYYFTYDKPIDKLLIQVISDEENDINPTEWLRVDYTTKEICKESIAAGDNGKV